MQVTTAHARFFDVDPDHPYFAAIEFLTREGIVSGYENRSFRPENAINRAEFTKILIETLYPKEYIDSCLDDMVTRFDEAAGTMGEREAMQVIPLMEFPDVPYNAWFSKYICIAWSNGIVSGYPDGLFRPEEGVKFVEAAKMLSIGFGLTGLELPNFGATNVVWYQPYVEFLADQNAIPFSIAALDQPLNRGEMAELIYRLKDKPFSAIPVQAKSKMADDVIYPVDFHEFVHDDYEFAFSFPNVWPEPHTFKRGYYDGRSPFFPSDWTVFFGPKPEECEGLNECVKRNMWIDGYPADDAVHMIDAIERDQFYIELEEEGEVNTLPTIVLREEVGDCIDKRGFYFGQKWIYILNIRCGGQDAKLENMFNQIALTFRPISYRPPEHRQGVLEGK